MKYILPIGIVLCGVISSAKALDPSGAVRHMGWCVLTLVLCALYLLKKKKDLSVLQTSLFLVFVIYCLATTVSIFKAVNTSESLYAVLVAWVSLIFFTCIASEIDKKIVIKTLVYMGLVFAIYGLYDIIRADDIKTTYGLGFANGRNLWSSTLLLLLPFSLYSVFKNKNRMAILTAALLLVNIACLQTRSVYLALVVSVAMTLIFYKKKAVILFLVLMVICVFGFERLRDTESLSWRLQCWGRTVKVFFNDPVFGVGAGNWKITVPKYSNNYTSKSRDDVEFYYTRAHNDFLEVLSETGAMGGLSYVGIFLIAIYYSLRQRDKVLAWSMRFGTISYMTFAFFSFPKERAIHSILIFTMIALLAREYPKRNLWSLSRNIKSFAFCAAVVMFGFFVSHQRYRTEVYCREVIGLEGEAFVTNNKENWKRIVNIIDDNYTPFSTMINYSVSPIYQYRAEAQFYLGNHKEAISDYYKSLALHPYHAATLANLGTYKYVLKDYMGAKYFFDRAYQVYPDLELISTMLEDIEKQIVIR